LAVSPPVPAHSPRSLRALPSATEADWIRFRDECVGPAVGKVRAEHGITNDEWLATHEEVDVIDVWQVAG
jgi:hypothetical protein